MSDDKLQNKIYRAARAKALLNDEMLKECLDRLESVITADWQNAKETATREHLWFELQGLRGFRQLLTNMISGGALAQRELDDLIAKQERERV
jgi:hypothetical protein